METPGKLRARHALPSELDEVYRISHTAWGDCKAIGEYIEECRASKKYAQGAWFVLSDRELTLYSSLIVYRFPTEPFPSIGIGSLATRPEKRKQGYAAELLRGVLARFEEQGVTRAYLYSDIAPAYYERLGFEPLPEHLQKKPSSIAMVRGLSEAEVAAPGFFVPDYF